MKPSQTKSPYTTEAALVYVQQFEWLTTAPNPLLPGYAEPRGWKCHATQKASSYADIRVRPAACGYRAKHGWAMDLFIEKKCARCLVALGVECKACRGTGYDKNNYYSGCMKCKATGESEAFRTQQGRMSKAST